ncbi:transcription factor 25-like [Chenopodium quinoa]|uniref:transcription factor 25-like n=1 Tax=Chenopodium quinoa TaxID=63459 RepID=UPI000B78B638|nr:transcription factor 25-like [Chenopodium quinoa]
MSGRLLRKVMKEQEQSQKREGDVIEEELQEDLDDDESDSDAQPKNPFDLLNDDDDHENDQEDESSAIDDALEDKINDSESVMRSYAPTVPVSNKKSKKKKKKKNKEVSLSNADRSKKSVEVDIESLSLDIDPAPEATSSKNIRARDTISKLSKSCILKVDPKFLNAEYELRRIFGSKVVSSFENANQGSTSRQVRGGRRGLYSHKKCILVSPNDHWPRWDGSLSMELLETKDGNNYFRYVHSASYSHIQRAFEAAKATHDLNGVASILMHHPYHVESLMTLADYFRFSGEHQMAADAIAKCLYALECAWHPMFSPLQADCRLEYTHETNKPLFSTLFCHMKNLDRRGCHRSALEVCKLLLSLDPADPMGAMFCIDYFSLRAEEYAWLEQFSDEYQSDNSLWNFPNFAYSLAICRLFLERDSTAKDNKNLQDIETSSGLMKQALMLHPPVLRRLVDKVPLKDQALTTITKNPFFKSEDTGIPSLDHLIRIYIERSYIIWRLPDVQKLLKDAALGVIESLKHDSSEANTWACVRKEAFPSDKNEYGHLMVSEFSDTVATMPPENLQNFMVLDPRMREMVENQDQGANVQVRVPRELADRSPLAVLFESLLPWVDYGAGEADNDQPHHQDN